MKQIEDDLESNLVWLCSTCKISPRTPIHVEAKKGDTRFSHCSKCGGSSKFVFTESINRAKRHPRKTKPVKMTSNKATEKSLNAAAQSKGVGIKKKDFGHKANREVLLRVNQLSEKFVRPWMLGLEHD